jgi:hypothetical protein
MRISLGTILFWFKAAWEEFFSDLEKEKVDIDRDHVQKEIGFTKGTQVD